MCCLPVNQHQKLERDLGKSDEFKRGREDGLNDFTFDADGDDEYIRGFEVGKNQRLRNVEKRESIIRLFDAV